MGLGERLAHRLLDLIAAPLFAASIKREKHSAERETIRALVAERAEQFPIIKEHARGWSREMVHPPSPADAPIREYLQLDPDAV
jgi:hypothetical protein